MKTKTIISLYQEQITGEIDDHLFGANLEHLGQSVYGGHWAEMLKDRKFAGHDQTYVGLNEGLEHEHPGFGVVVPWEPVNADRQNVLFVHDNSTYFYSL